MSITLATLQQAISVRAAKQKAYNGPGVTREVRNRAAYAEFIGAQLKVCSHNRVHYRRC